MPISRTYYWIYGNDNGKPFLYPGGETFEEAQRKGVQQVSCYFEVKALPTRDIATASRMLRAEYLEDTNDISETLRIRYKHKEN